VPDHDIAMTNIQTELRLLPGDLWELNHFRAQFAGADLQLSGVISNASVIRDWNFMHPHEPSVPGVLERRVQRFADALGRIHFSSTPQLILRVDGDARDLQSFAVRLNVASPGAETPWGAVDDAAISVVLYSATTNVSSHAEINLHAAAARGEWAGQMGSVTNFELRMNLFSTYPGTNVVYGDLDASASAVETKWARAANPHFLAEWVHSVTNPIPLSGWGELQATEVRTRWGDVAQASLTGTLLSATNQVDSANESWAWWKDIAPYSLDWECLVRGLRSPKLSADEVLCSGEWRAPELSLTKISGALYEGKIDADAHLDVASRDFRFTASSDFDAQRISPLLTEKSQHWLTQFSWNSPPRFQAQGSMTLPAWTNREPSWRAEVRPTILLDGSFQVGNGSFRGVSFRSADSRFSYSNLCWHLPNLVARRPEGWVSINLDSNEKTSDYYFRLHSTIDPLALRPLFETNQQRALDLVTFTQPPAVDGELWGRWYDHDLIGGRATLMVNNFAFRGEPIGLLQTTVEYTNQSLLVLNPHAERGPEKANASAVLVDFATRKVYITNAVGTADPLPVARMIGPKPGGVMSPYRFTQPPTIHAYGSIGMHVGVKDADLHFDVDGGPFQWWKFKADHVSGKVDWVGDRLTLRDVKADLYKGNASGTADFDFAPPGAEFRFDTTAFDMDLRSLMEDLVGKTNRLEGLLTAQISISSGNSSDLHTLQGKGLLSLRDGLIWDIPIFGILSPVLDALAPGSGLGSSRAREATANFAITNGVMHTEDLQIRATLMRLQYWGTVDLNGRVDARAQAELLRDTWAVGRVISLALWPVSKVFEYKITGTLHEPRSEPVFFVPRVLLFPFHPIKTMKDLIEEPAPLYQSFTNQPPMFK
jgi:hypothetical protein